MAHVHLKHQRQAFAGRRCKFYGTLGLRMREEDALSVVQSELPAKRRVREVET